MAREVVQHVAAGIARAHHEDPLTIETAHITKVSGMQFELPNGAQLVKLGFSRNPDSRLRHQLLKHRSVEAQILKTVPMATGQLALQTEKRLHTRLKTAFPDSIAPPDLYAGSINVRSEIYFADVTAEIVRMLDEIATDGAA